MAFITCPNCWHQIDDNAISCPKCGCPVPGRSKDGITANNPADSNYSTQSRSTQGTETNDWTSKETTTSSVQIEKNNLSYKAPIDDKTTQIHSEEEGHGKSLKNKNLKTILTIIAVSLAVCSTGAYYGIHKHKVKVLDEQQAALQLRLEEEARQKALEDSIARVNFQTPDLKMLSAHGPVESIIYINGIDPVLGMDYVSFDENGVIKKMISDGLEFPKGDALLKRDASNLIEEWSCCLPDLDCEVYGKLRRHFTYSADSFVKRISAEGIESAWDATLTWNETGNLSKFTIEGSGDGWGTDGFGEGTTTKNFIYVEEDDYGNWTKAEVKITEISSDFDGTSQREEYKQTINRKIVYYE